MAGLGVAGGGGGDGGGGGCEGCVSWVILLKEMKFLILDFFFEMKRKWEFGGLIEKEKEME